MSFLVTSSLVHDKVSYKLNTKEHCRVPSFQRCPFSRFVVEFLLYMHGPGLT